MVLYNNVNEDIGGNRIEWGTICFGLRKLGESVTLLTVNFNFVAPLGAV